MSRRALITGITGQDGSYLTELLLGKGYEVYGIIRRSSSFNTQRIDHIYQDPHEIGRRLKLVYGDLNDASSLNKILRDVQPDEIYNLGAQSHVRVSSARSGRCDCSKRFARPDSIRASIRHLRRSCSVKYRKSRSAKRRPSTRAALTGSRSSIPIGSPSITARATMSSPVTESFSIMNRNAATRLS